jgi:hypothetical protein
VRQANAVFSSQAMILGFVLLSGQAIHDSRVHHVVAEVRELFILSELKL